MHPCVIRLFGTLTIRQRRPDGLTSRKPFGACVIPAAQPNIRPNIDLQCGYSATNQTTDLQRTAAPCAEYSVCGMSMCSRECRTQNDRESCALKLFCESAVGYHLSIECRPAFPPNLAHWTLHSASAERMRFGGPGRGEDILVIAVSDATVSPPGCPERRSKIGGMGQSWGSILRCVLKWPDRPHCNNPMC